MNIRMRTNFAFSIPVRRASQRFRWALLMMLICLCGLATALSSADLTLAAPYEPATQSTSVIDLSKCTSPATIIFAETTFTITPPEGFDTISTKVYTFSGTVDGSGKIVIPKANLHFEKVPLEENTGLLELQEDATGYVSPNTGVMQLTMNLKLFLSEPESEEACFLGPIALAMTSTDGTAYSPINGSAKLVAKNWPLPAVTSSDNCGAATAAGINSSKLGLGLPWAAGAASAMLPVKLLTVVVTSAVENAGKWQEGEPNNDAAHANALSGTPIAISGNINLSDADYFSIMIPKNTSVTISHSSKTTVNSSEPCDPNAGSGSSTAIMGGPLVAINGKANYTESIQETDTGGCSGSNGTKGFMKATTTYTYTLTYTFPAKTADRTETFPVTVSNSSRMTAISGKYTLNLKFLKQ